MLTHARGRPLRSPRDTGSELADWKTEGAKARPATPNHRAWVPAALRATTWIRVLLLIAAVFVSPSDS
ncbi:hypothetical protein [Curtobacterium sp. AB7]|uniref:hypothetical protein n=1 Tax=Curtobacterium sp. AB7 TaxID=3349327 RepID=UPI00383693A0